MRISAASTIMARLVRVVDAVAVLGPVHNSHIMVADAARVLAVFIIARAAAVLHRCLRQRGAAWGWETRCAGAFLARFCDVAAVE